MDYGTIKIPRDEYEKHNERREDMGLSWAEYIDGEAPEDSDIKERIDELHEQIPNKTAAEVEDRLR